uniref:Prefoldin subunit 4 n=1 Tax=Prymnesium polylepis TaxID=72548 RepID=A0A6T8A4P7_9EUKA|mmetsp:Transcript_31177/g.76678  ORF Transcript_31177/g.76678 Transcript_31177/m.76678 type:complete len:124 (+) Transcript_31177:29-400(+)
MGDDDVEVRWEDQQKINTFGRLNTRMHDLEDEIKEKVSKSELLDDAANEIILADDDELIRYVFGECYFEVSKDRADELLEEQKAKVDEEVETLKKELGGINDTLTNLKKQLYARFGGNINLEE